MTDSAETSSFPAAAAGGGQSGASVGATSSAEPSTYGSAYGSAASGASAGSASERPELVVGAAFAGGFLAALILKRIAR